MPHQLEEYSNQFIQERGHAFRNLKQMILRTEAETKSQAELFVCATKSNTGQPHLFQFAQHKGQEDNILKAIEASCRIPTSFHPFDIIFRSNPTYEQEGILIEGDYYCDGGISAPLPPTPKDNCQILVSPIAMTEFSSPNSAMKAGFSRPSA